MLCLAGILSHAVISTYMIINVSEKWVNRLFFGFYNVGAKLVIVR